MSAYIFDLDGTLLDSTGVWDKIDVEFLAKRGLVPTDEYKQSIAVMSFPEAAEYTIKLFNLPDSPADLQSEWNSMAHHAYCNTIELKSGAKEYLQKLKQANVKLAIATSAISELCYAALDRHNIFHLFDCVCFSDEVGCGKSKPYIYELAANRLNTAVNECVVFEDTLEAIKSAKSIGATVYGVYDEMSKLSFEQIKQISDGVIYNFNSAPII